MPLNSSAGMCDSISGLAEAINTQGSVIVHDCEASACCDGVSCQFDVLSSEWYYLELIILPCEGTVDIVIKDRERKRIANVVVDKRTAFQWDIFGQTIEINATFIQHDYSMELEVRNVFVTVVFQKGRGQSYFEAVCDSGFYMHLMSLLM